jgi:hypothetical protein
VNGALSATPSGHWTCYVGKLTDAGTILFQPHIPLAV